MKRLGLALLSLFAVVGCSRAELPTDGTASSSARSEETSQLSSATESRNVSFVGTIREMGPSIHMEGTHQLELTDGRSILTESDVFDLGKYVNKHVIILGAVRPTVEGNATIVRIEQITILEESAESEEPAASSSAAPPAQASSIPLPASSATRKPPASSLQAKSSSVSSAAESTPPMAGGDDDMQLRAAAMAKGSMADANWTQQYCTTHIGFCFPVHKNWWFKSFGTTTSSLWHIEISDGEITELGQGPIVVNLVSGTVESEGAQNGQVKPQGNFVVGFAAWTENRHFEVSAPPVLEPAIRYLIAHIIAKDQ